MKANNLAVFSAFLLSSLLITPAFAESKWSGNDQKDRVKQERGNEVKSRHKDRQNQQKKYLQKKEHRQSNKRVNPDHRNQLSKHERRNSQHQKPRVNKNYERHGSRDYDKKILRTDRPVIKRQIYRDHYRHTPRYETRRGNKLLVLAPRHRLYHNIHIVRPYGHAYFGYGHFLHDDHAWRWLTFTAITLKLLDMVDEQAQREHEAAQIDATEAELGEKIYWDTDDASGYVVTTREGVSSRGLTCREYQHSITVGGETEEAYGTACLQPDGAWKIVD
jgi:hypothetical protein